ncbi:MAG: heparinase II/III family protein [Phycisphaerales bacterium]|nr:MAG: heparinase II/III family protein [Phycisphaerales bacterium]
MRNNPGRIPLKFLVAIAVLVLLFAGLIWGVARNTTAPDPLRDRLPAGEGAEPRSVAAGPVAELLLADPRTVDARWILAHLQFPGEQEARAREAAADEERFDEFLGAYFRSRPDVRGLPMRFIRSRGDTIEFYDLGLLVIASHEPVPFEVPPDWGRTDLGLTFQAELHSWRFLTNFLTAYEETGREDYREVLEALVEDWIEKNPYENPAHPRAWHEGAMAKRILVLLNLFNRYKNMSEVGGLRLRTILAMIIQHAEFFASGEHYKPAGNHGIRQDIGLIAAAVAIPEARNTDSWLRIATERLRFQQVEPGFTPEGVWREHSPVYHNYVMRLFSDLLDIVDENGADADLDFLRELALKSRRYMAHVLTPTGHFPPVGDSGEERFGISRWSDGPAVRYSASGGEEGSPPDELDGFFPDAGEAVFRDNWGDDPRSAQNAFYIHMHAAFHPTFGHRHVDDLSFVFHGLGRWWIIETGKWGYERNKWRAYVESARAHNSYTFEHDALHWSDDEDPAKDVYFEDAMVSSDTLAAVRGRTNRFAPADTSVTRTIVFLRNRRTVLLLDHLESARRGDWQGYLHLPPDIEPARAGRARIVGRTSTHPDLELEITGEPEQVDSLEIVIGREDPLLGWYSPAFLEMVPAPTVVFERAGSDVLAATVIRVKDRDGPSVTDLVSARKNGECEIRWREGRELISITITTERPLQASWTCQPAVD